jgi:hypothetical protein
MIIIPALAAASFSTPVTLWRSADGQSTIDMSGATAAEAVAELLAQCGSEDERAGILAGSFTAQLPEALDY